MIWLRIAAVAVVLVGTAVQLTYVNSLRKRVERLERESSTVTHLTRSDWPKLPTTTHRWEIIEDDGTWAWMVFSLHHTYDHAGSFGGWLATPEIKTRSIEQDGGTTDSRKAAERAVERWFWREFKRYHTPSVDAMRSSGVETVKP